MWNNFFFRTRFVVWLNNFRVVKGSMCNLDVFISPSGNVWFGRWL